LAHDFARSPVSSKKRLKKPSRPKSNKMSRQFVYAKIHKSHMLQRFLLNTYDKDVRRGRKGSQVGFRRDNGLPETDAQALLVQV